MKNLICSAIISTMILANQNGIGEIYYFKDDSYNENIVEECTLYVSQTEQKAEYLIDKLLENKNNNVTSVPHGTKLLWVFYEDGRIILNFSKEAENCAGNLNQRTFVSQIVKTLYSIPEIRSIIIYTEGNETNLPEGYDFTAYDRW